MIVLESEFYGLLKNEIKKAEFWLRRWLTRRLFNFKSIKSAFCFFLVLNILQNKQLVLIQTSIAYGVHSMNQSIRLKEDYVRVEVDSTQDWKYK